MMKKNKSNPEVEVVVEVVDEIPEADVQASDVVSEEPPAEEVVPDGIIKVKAVIRPMYSPDDQLLIPEDHGVLIKKSSWSTSQLERGLLRIVE